MTIDENQLAQVICRANLEKKVNDYARQSPGGIDAGMRVKLEHDIAKHWQSYLPEARAVAKMLAG